MGKPADVPFTVISPPLTVNRNNVMNTYEVRRSKGSICPCPDPVNGDVGQRSCRAGQGRLSLQRASAHPARTRFWNEIRPAPDAMLP
jgi:hypothetical protein